MAAKKKPRSKTTNKKQDNEESIFDIEVPSVGEAFDTTTGVIVKLGVAALGAYAVCVGVEKVKDTYNKW